MKINETGRINAMNPYQRSADAQRQEQMKKSSRKDEVSISDEAIQLLQAQNSGNDAERALKIDSLKQQVSAGTYQVDAAKLAEKLAPYFKQSSEN
ncbi:flagellar biosynthesis anti-sigma factor FlgM [Paenibacillus sp. VTT E-133280]|jgi:negative regulator of flagellin synthesis FlgM|uniref:Negative regulator of flagellin synthesis n=1 Tax=Paenibacillus odorifer TaxID=189426 RepID=A0A1R0ZD19_9BACL|nr:MULTISPECIES: flagellar biosynthesis anti-sigma factor FlgM [Paenibacillus]MBY3619215.1 flagellar biosynthesis anti-sigma factor FlgM [Acinetobacter sp. CUI P1]AIQ26386.1 flagellar synthesis anti-sigma-D factor [Paenibacillus sp. FSL H7-0737]KAA1186915.1 flagellar biosynthesis anti-sigma factor FlgM [Paenibacillus sp. B2(2019)]MDH6371060.1 negative regulator of flagellin synthesis FlgM [Paenibacillus sp. PastF-3]OME67329.1 flagellar biosynthesis anti-sigma factor FlgM [Paenibacillus odorife